MSSLTFAGNFARVLRRDLKEKNQVPLQRLMWSLLAKWETPLSAGFQILHMGKGNVGLKRASTELLKHEMTDYN